MTPWLRVEFHCHTRYSRDSITSIQNLLTTAHQRGLDRLVVTDHNNIQGAMYAKAIDPQLVIVGEEIVTDRGELLASFVEEEVPRGLPWREAVERLRQQGAFISVSHPFDVNRAGWHLPHLIELYPLVDAIEVFNARCFKKELNEQAQDFAKEHNLAGTVGSDAHHVSEIGVASLRLPEFSSAEELRQVIRQGQPQVKLSPWWVHMYSQWARVARRWKKA